jgi:hypothetical protein
MDKIRDTLPISFRYCGVLNQEWCDTFLLVQTVEAVSISTNSYTQLPYFRHMCVWSELYCILCRHSLKTKDRQIKMGIPPLKFPFAERESGSVPEQGRCACLINHGFSLITENNLKKEVGFCPGPHLVLQYNQGGETTLKRSVWAMFFLKLTKFKPRNSAIRT